MSGSGAIGGQPMKRGGSGGTLYLTVRHLLFACVLMYVQLQETR